MEMGIQKHQLYLVSLENRVYFHVNGNSQIEPMALYALSIVYMHTSTYLTNIHCAGSIKLIQGLKSNWASISILCIQMQCHSNWRFIGSTSTLNARWWKDRYHWYWYLQWRGFVMPLGGYWFNKVLFFVDLSHVFILSFGMAYTLFIWMLCHYDALDMSWIHIHNGSDGDPGSTYMIHCLLSSIWVS